MSPTPSSAAPLSQPDEWSPRSALHDNNERFRLLVENSHDIIVEVSSEREVLYVSPNVATVLGYTPRELIGSDLFERVHREDLAHVLAQFAQKSGRATCRHRHRDGSWRWFETTSREFATKGGEVHRVLVARDITAQKFAAAERERLEAELARAEKLSAVGTLAAGMTHDFNNLLTAIQANADLARSYALPSAARQALDQINRAVDRAKDIARQVLDYCALESRAPVNLSVVAREVLALLRITFPPQIEVVTDFAERGCVVLGNDGQLHQVIVNLCQNAAHAMRHRRGRLVVRVAPVDIDEGCGLRPSGLRRGAYVCLSVIDSGHGMDAATQRRIFEPFFTTKPPGEGTGVGLVVVQTIVREHHGIIDVVSHPGEGTAFRIFLPARRE